MTDSTDRIGYSNQTITVGQTVHSVDTGGRFFNDRGVIVYDARTGIGNNNMNNYDEIGFLKGELIALKEKWDKVSSDLLEKDSKLHELREEIKELRKEFQEYMKYERRSPIH